MNKNIVVSGVSRGLGLEIARQLLVAGHRVYGISRTTSEELRQLKVEFSEQLLTAEFDLEAIEAIHADLIGEFLPLEIPLHAFVNNAAIAYEDLISELKIPQLESMYRVNVFAPMVLTKHLIRNMLLHKTEGSIVHISSISAHRGFKGLAMYGSTKGALEAFSKTTAREWGRRGIRSNCVVAGFMETDLSASLSEEERARIQQRTALRQPTATSDVAAAVLYLLSDAGRSITGQNLVVDSGTI